MRRYRRSADEYVEPTDRVVSGHRDETADRVVHDDEVALASDTHGTRVYDERTVAPAYDEVVSDRRGTWYFDSLTGRVNSVLGVLLLALEGVLALRFALVAFGANRTSGFVDFVLNVSWPFVRPFTGAFSNRTWDQGVIEVSTLLAMAVWALVFLLVAMLVNAALPRIDETAVTHRRRVTHV